MFNRSELNLSKDTSYLALTGKQWSASESILEHPLQWDYTLSHAKMKMKINPCQNPMQGIHSKEDKQLMKQSLVGGVLDSLATSVVCLQCCLISTSVFSDDKDEIYCYTICIYKPQPELQSSTSHPICSQFSCKFLCCVYGTQFDWTVTYLLI